MRSDRAERETTLGLRSHERLRACLMFGYEGEASVGTVSVCVCARVSHVVSNKKTGFMR